MGHGLRWTVCLLLLTVGCALPGSATTRDAARWQVTSPFPRAPAALTLTAPSALASSSPALADQLDAEADDDSDGHDWPLAVALYLPNRLFDLLDVVRARVRLGPGLAVGLRATEVADLFVGSYTSVYLGLPGPRGAASIPWPVGLEGRTGLELSVADATLGGPLAPEYGLAEVGFGGQLALFGFDVGVDLFEVFDAVLGIVTIDVAEDDF